MTRGNPSDLQPFDLEIDRTFHRLVRHSVHLDYPEHFVPFEHPEHFVIGESEHSVVDDLDRKSTRLNSSHLPTSRMPSSA